MSAFTKSFISSISLISFIGALPALVSAHGHVTGCTVGGEYKPGFPSDYPGSASPDTIAWSVNNPNNGFTNDYGSPDIICHKEAKPAKASATIAAGGTVEFQWTQWPAHQGPVVDYMAKCPGKCEDVDKTQLRWFKVAEQGLISQTGCNEKGNTGCWALDKLIQAGGKWSVTIPSGLEPGNYVMRHEVINIDFPGQPQNYPACINLIVTGGGSCSPEGVVGTSLYTGKESGLNFNIYGLQSAEYPIPGPPIASCSPSATGGGANTTYSGIASAALEAPSTKVDAQSASTEVDVQSASTEVDVQSSSTEVDVQSSSAEVDDQSSSAEVEDQGCDSDDEEEDEEEDEYPRTRARRWVA